MGKKEWRLGSEVKELRIWEELGVIDLSFETRPPGNLYYWLDFPLCQNRSLSGIHHYFN